MSESTPLPCPFCGKEATAEYKTLAYEAGCKDDSCPGYHGNGLGYGTRQLAIAAWNRRTPQAGRYVPVEGNEYGTPSKAKGWVVCRWQEGSELQTGQWTEIVLGEVKTDAPGTKIVVNGEWLHVIGRDDQQLPFDVHVQLPPEIRLFRRKQEETPPPGTARVETTTFSDNAPTFASVPVTEPLWTKSGIEKQVSRIEKGALSCYDSLYHMSREYETDRKALLSKIDALVESHKIKDTMLTEKDTRIAELEAELSEARIDAQMWHDRAMTGWQEGSET